MEYSLTEKKISIIIPVYNEEENIALMMMKLLNLHLRNKQIIFIDDGSTDNTLNIIKQYSNDFEEVHYISFSRNFGHQIALKAGFDYADGDCAITMDGDMQHPTELIEQMIKIWLKGADVVHTRRLPEEHQSIVKRMTSSLFYKVMRIFSSVIVQPGTADFRLVDAKILAIAKNLYEGNFFWRGLIPWMGFRQVYIDYVPNHRLHGKSKYSLKKMLNLAWDGIFSFSLLPLRLAIGLGSLMLAAVSFYTIYIIGVYIFTDNTISGWTSLALLGTSIGSVQLIFLGILGEYIGRIFLMDKRRPYYIVKEHNISSKE